MVFLLVFMIEVAMEQVFLLVLQFPLPVIQPIYLLLLFLWGSSAYVSGSTSALWLIVLSRIGHSNFLDQFRNATPP
jgi:hypothetical protein